MLLAEFDGGQTIEIDTVATRLETIIKAEVDNYVLKVRTILSYGSIAVLAQSPDDPKSDLVTAIESKLEEFPDKLEANSRARHCFH